MGKLDLRIDFDRPDRTYEPGAEIRGRVEVGVNQDVRCKALTIELGWATHGRGNRDAGVLDRHEEPGPLWNAGQTYQYPFSFKVPERPLTYRGSYVNVDQYVMARADIPWAIDPKLQEDFIVRAGSSSREFHLSRSLDLDKAFAAEGKTGIGCKILGFIILGPILLMLFALLAMLLPIILIVVGVRWARKRLAERKLGKVDVHLDAEVASNETPGETKAPEWVERRLGTDRIYAISPGDSLPVRMEFMPGDAVDITRITAELHGEERATAGSGSNSVTYRHDIHKSEIVLAEGARYRAGERVKLAGSVPVPDVEAYSFSASDNDVEWSLEMHVDIPGWPDWTETVQLRMVPR